jgi:hypothetical protein
MAFRAALEAWAYDAHWRLWEMGTSATRASLPRQNFAERLQANNAEPEGGSHIEVIEVRSKSPIMAPVRTRFRLRYTHREWSEVVERLFLRTFEEGEWRVNLWDFVGLASYFPPEYPPMPSGPFPRGGCP